MRKHTRLCITSSLLALALEYYFLYVNQLSKRWNCSFSYTGKKYMRQKFLKLNILLLLGFMLCLDGFGQIRISGKVTDDKNKPLPFSNVTLRSADDSSRVILGTLTDLNGEFILATPKTDFYYLAISFLGKEAEICRIDSKADTVLNISLKERRVYLSGATVSANRELHEINKSVYLISSAQKSIATSSLTLLSAIPSLSVSEVNSSITTNMGQPVLILINGRTASSIELHSLQPKNVAKVEYYRIPPARYLNSNYASVINVITKQAIEGGNLYANLQNTPSDKYGNHIIAGDYNRNRSQLYWYYYYSYRNYSDKQVNESREYTVANSSIRSNRLGEKSPFGYNMHIANLSYVNSKDSSYLFSIKASPNITTSYSRPRYQIVRQQNGNMDKGTGQRNSRTYEFSPSIDIYFSRMFSKNSELLANIVGSIFDGSSSYLLNEQRTDGSSLLSDFMNSTNRKRSIISELVYTRSFSSFNLNVGAKDSEGLLDQTINNTFGNGTYTLTTSERYGYAELNGEIKSFSFAGSAGITYNSFSQSEGRGAYSYYSFRPSLKISYRVNNRSMIRLSYSKFTTMPTLAELSNQSYFNDVALINTGNANLKPFDTHAIQLLYTTPLSFISSEFQLTYNYAKNPILTSYILEPTYIRLSPNNENRSSEIAFSSTFKASILPKNMLDFSMVGWVSRVSNSYEKRGNINVWIYGLRFMLQSRYKSFNLTAYYQNPIVNLKNEYVFTGSADSDISLNYRYKQVTLGTGVYLPLHKSYYTKGYTASSSLVKESYNNRIYTNGNMAYFRLVYFLPFGRKMVAEKKIKNQDGDSGILKVE